nr:hypothetical protein [Tanacetum cinerariifolium]
MASKIAAQELEITSLKARVKLLEDKDGGGAEPSGEDATIKERSLETGEEAAVEKSTERGSNDTEELVNVLTSLDAASILTSGVQMVSVPPAAEVATFLLLLFNSSANFWQWHLLSSGSGNNLYWQWELILPVGTLNMAVGMPCAFYSQQIVMENQSDVQNHLVEIQAGDHDLLVNSDNENDDMLGYESEKYSDDEDANGTNHAEDADGTNHSDLKLRYFNVELIVKKLVMHRLGKLLRNFRMKMREKYILPNLKTPSKLNELPTKYSVIVKAEERDEFREADDKIKEGTLNLDDGTHAMTVVFGKEKGGYARGVGSGVTNKRHERQQKDVLVKKLSTEMTKKDVLVKELSNEMTKTMGMLSQLMNQLAAQGVQLNLSSQLQVASDVTPIGAYEVDGTQSSVVVRDKDARIRKKSNGLVTSEKASNCKLWHLKKSNIVALGTVYKSDGKQMLHNQALAYDCNKVSIDSSLV